jgi:hypothetical protein
MAGLATLAFAFLAFGLVVDAGEFHFMSQKMCGAS